MTYKAGGNPLSPWCKGRFLFLLISLLGLIVLAPLLESFVGIRILLDIFVTAVFIAGIYAISGNRLTSVIAIILALPMFAATWSTYLLKSTSLVLVGNLFGILFLACTVVAILSFILQEKKVTADVIYGAVVVYLLMAIMWAFIYRFLETLHPGSFAIAQSGSQESRSLFTYYSFVTITTLGYGDVAPLTKAARAFSLLEAIVGQMYLVVLVARLVGIHISQSMTEK
jgi:hypothetical protein